MDDHDLAAKLVRDRLTATAALIALALTNLPDDVRTRALDAVRSGTGNVDLNARGVERDGVGADSDGRVGVLWLARTGTASGKEECFMRCLASAVLVALFSYEFAVSSKHYSTTRDQPRVVVDVLHVAVTAVATRRPLSN